MKLVLVSYLISATFILLLLNLSTTSHRGSSHLRISRRLGHKHAPFDPLVGKLERLVEEKESMNGKPESNLDMDSFSGELSDTEEYLEEEGRLNITLRLMILFPFVDRFPQDGFISFKELENWNVERAVERLNYKTMKEMRLRDKDGDDSLSLTECLHRFSLSILERNDMDPGQVGWWKEQFYNADADGNGFLNLSELNDFLNPKDSENEEIQEWLLREKIRFMDYDKDGKLNFVEFREQAYDIYKNHAEYDYNGNDIPKPEEKFAELDLDLDKFLTVEEMLPILHQLYPGEITFATYYAKYLIRQADEDKDGKLMINEILNHEEDFYSKVFEREFDDNHEEDDEDDDDDDDYFINDEF